MKTRRYLLDGFMAEPTQFAFELQEVTELLIKQQGIHEGVWTIGFEFGFGAGAMALKANEIRPGAMVQINKLLLHRPPEGAPTDSPTFVDAAKVNPKK